MTKCMETGKVPVHSEFSYFVRTDTEIGPGDGHFPY